MDRILYAYPEVSPLFVNGGVGTFVCEAATLLAKSGQWEVDILTDVTYAPGLTQEDFRKAKNMFREVGIRLIDLNRDDGVPVVWPAIEVTRAERYHRHIARLHQERHYDVIEFPDWRAPGFFVIREKRTTRAFHDTRLVVHCHSSTKNVWDWLDGSFLGRNDFYCHYMEEYVKKYADTVLSPSEYLLCPVRQTQHVFLKLLLRNGYPISSIQPDAAGTSGNGRESRSITVACISRLERRKGQDILAQTIRRLSESTAWGEEVRFIFRGKDGVGFDRDGAMSQSIRRILNGVERWEIVPPKNRQDLLRWLSTEVDICVVPSRGDNYPNAVLEAARAGCYVIGSDAGGIPEIFKDYGIVGAVFPSEDCQALEQELRKAIQRIRDDPGLRVQIAQSFEEHRQKQEQRTLATYAQMVKDKKQRQAWSVDQKPEPRVSIIIPFYNTHQYARDAIRSAFASNYHNFEVILVNDGSDDPQALTFLKKIEAEFPDLRVIHKANGGLGDARNAGLKAASGEFIVPLDADNLILPGMLRACSWVLTERTNLAYVTTYFECLKEDGARVSWRQSPIAKPIGAVEPFLLLENSVGDALGMVRKSVLDEVGGYSTRIYCFEDWDLWLRLHEQGQEGDVIPEVHFLYRLRSDSMSRSLDASTGLRLQQALLREHVGLMRDQSLAISTLLLHEYWQQWRKRKTGEAENNGRLLSWDNVRRGVKDPIYSLRYLMGKFIHWIRV